MSKRISALPPQIKVKAERSVKVNVGSSTDIDNSWLALCGLVMEEVGVKTENEGDQTPTVKSENKGNKKTDSKKDKVFWENEIKDVFQFGVVPSAHLYTKYRKVTPNSTWLSKATKGYWVQDVADMAEDYNRGSFLDRWAVRFGWDREEVISLKTAFLGPKGDQAVLEPLRSGATNKKALITALRKRGFHVVASYLAYKRDSMWAQWFHAMMPKGPDISGYISRFTASCIGEVWASAEVRKPYYQAKDGWMDLGSDGASWGWNVDHPDWADFRAKYGITSFQFTFATVDGALAKGIMMPASHKDMDKGPSCWIAPNAFKGSAKKSAKEGQTYTGLFGIMEATDLSDKGEQVLGWQWMENVVNNNVTREIVTRRSLQALFEIIDSGPSKMLSMLEAEGGNVSIGIKSAKARGFSPLAIPSVTERLESMLSGKLWDSFTSLGVYGKTKRLVMDASLQPGEIVIPGIDPKYYGERIVVWRSPIVHNQAIMSCVIVAPKAHHSVTVNGVQVALRGHAFLNLRDTARINGDDDGDKLAFTFDRDILTLAEETEAEFGNTLWSFEPTASDVSIPEMGTEAGDDWIQFGEKGPVGIAANLRSQCLSLEGVRLPKAGVLSLTLACSVLQQQSVDCLKKWCLTHVFQILGDLSNWATNGNEVKAPRPDSGKGLTIHEAVEELQKAVSEIRKEIRGKRKGKYPDPVSWKKHWSKEGKVGGKCQIFADNWVVCSEKDAGYSEITGNASLLHIAHDACAIHWNKWKSKFFGGKANLQELVKDVDLSALSDWQCEVSDKEMEQALKVADQAAARRADLMSRHLIHMDSWDGDDDGGKGLAEIHRQFTRSMAKLGAKLQWLVALKWQERAVSLWNSSKSQKDWMKEETIREARNQKRLAWEALLFDGSPFVDALGLEGAKCRAISVDIATDSVLKAEKEAKEEQVTLQDAILRLLQEGNELDSLHFASTGIDLMSCKPCMMRLKQALAEKWRDTPISPVHREICNWVNAKTQAVFLEESNALNTFGQPVVVLENLRNTAKVMADEGHMPELRFEDGFPSKLVAVKAKAK